VREDGHPAPWILALDAAPPRASVLDEAARGAIAPRFSDLKGRGFNLGDSPLPHAERVERLVLIMARRHHRCHQPRLAHG
jgi:hypothetical protein